MSKKNVSSAPAIEIIASKYLPLGIPAEYFFQHYWQKHPLLIRQAFPDFEPPLTPDDLAGLSLEQHALSRLVILDRKKDHWQLRNGPFTQDSFKKLPKRDWTLLVQDVDKWDADVAALIDYFDFLPRWRIDDVMISFAAPGGSVGAHIDQYDVFLLQAHGQRHWQIDSRPNPDTHYRDDAELRLLKHFSPSHQWTLLPGDMLYLPPGVPHHGEAVDACMTFSIGMRAPAQAELIEDFAMHIASQLSETQRYTDPDLSVPVDPYEIDPAAITRLKSALRVLTEQSDSELSSWFGSFITRYRSAGQIAPASRLPSTKMIETTLANGGRLLRHPFARYAWMRKGKHGLLFADGHHFEMSSSSAKLIAQQQAIEHIHLDDMTAADRDVLAELIKLGHYQLEKPGRSS